MKENSFCNPFMMNTPDPFMFIHDGYYYLAATTRKNITIYRSKTLEGFSNPESKTIWSPEEGKPNSRDIWAPEIHNIGGKWFLYYTATDGKPENRRIFLLENDSGDLFNGKWEEKGRVIMNPDKWAIDATIVNDGENLYIAWSGWEGDVDEAQNIYIGKLKSPYEMEGERVLISVPEYEWECHPVPGQDYPTVNEGPIALYTENYISIVYSASHYTSDHYCLGILRIKRGKDLLNPANWEKHDKPIFEKSYENGVFSPGHNSFFKSPDGKEDWIVYHAFLAPPPFKNTLGRCAMAKSFIFDENEMPVLGKPLKVGLRVKAPSGEENL
ncbi:MAG TPA: family 43 glycosylhydrolase [Clostridiaceae bacterium]|nr:family 43 glycosylhydrolase [Clostridiaceae bacterium]